MKRFLIRSAILTILIFILGALLYSTVLKSYYFFTLPFLVLFFFVVTNLVHAYLLKIAGKSGPKFTSQYMATSFLKMFFFLLVAIAYIIIDKTNAKPFIFNFLLLYIIYAVLEVNEYLRVVKQLN